MNHTESQAPEKNKTVRNQKPTQHSKKAKWLGVRCGRVNFGIEVAGKQKGTTSGFGDLAAENVRSAPTSVYPVAHGLEGSWWPGSGGSKAAWCLAERELQNLEASSPLPQGEAAWRSPSIYSQGALGCPGTRGEAGVSSPECRDPSLPDCTGSKSPLSCPLSGSSRHLWSSALRSAETGTAPPMAQHGYRTGDQKLHIDTPWQGPGHGPVPKGTLLRQTHSTSRLFYLAQTGRDKGAGGLAGPPLRKLSPPHEPGVPCDQGNRTEGMLAPAG